MQCLRPSAYGRIPHAFPRQYRLGCSNLIQPRPERGGYVGPGHSDPEHESQDCIERDVRDYGNSERNHAVGEKGTLLSRLVLESTLAKIVVLDSEPFLLLPNCPKHTWGYPARAGRRCPMGELSEESRWPADHRGVEPVSGQQIVEGEPGAEYPAHCDPAMEAAGRDGRCDGRGPDEDVMPASLLRTAQGRTKELERTLGRNWTRTHHYAGLPSAEQWARGGVRA
jgi:hypothetical protein